VEKLLLRIRCFSVVSRMVQKLKSRGLTIVIVEHSTEPLVPSYSAVRRDRLYWNNETIVESLVVPLEMIMRHKLANRIPQRVFTKEDHLPQAILPNRSDEPFRVSIRIHGQLHRMVSVRRSVFR